MIFRVLLIVAAAGLALAQDPAAGNPQLDEEERTATKFINGICSTCHGADLIKETKVTRQEWLDIVKNMNNKGAGLSEQDVELLTNYLTRKYGPAADNTDVQSLRDALAPTGTLRAVFLGANPVQGVVNPQTGEATGPAPDVARELARRMGVPLSIRGLDGVPAVIEAVSKRTADIGFLAFDATRAVQVSFTQAYSIGHNTYMVHRNSPIRNIADGDRPGIRIGVGAGDAVDLHLTRTIKQAQIVRPANRTMEEAVRMLIAGEVDAYAANRQRLTEAAANAPNLRLIDGSVLGVQQSIVTAKENTAGIALLNPWVDDIRASGFLRDVIGRANLAGVEVAPRQ